MQDELIEIRGEKPGEVSVILAGVHGNETSGINALKKILPSLKIESGRIFVGYGNPKAIQINQRYTEVDLNRLFVNDDVLTPEMKESYEYQRAQYLKTFFNQSSALLDIHASTIPNSQPFIICEKNAMDIVQFLPVNLVVSGFDQVEPGGTDYYMNKQGNIGICLECGYVDDDQATNIAEEGIKAFLKVRGHIPGNTEPVKQHYIRMFKKYYSKTDNFKLSRPFQNFETVESGELIGIDGKEELRAPKKSVILFAHNSKKVGDEIFLLGEEKENLT